MSCRLERGLVAMSRPVRRAEGVEAHTRAELFIVVGGGIDHMPTRRQCHKHLLSYRLEVRSEVHRAFEYEYLLLRRLQTQVTKHLLIMSLHAFTRHHNADAIDNEESRRTEVDRSTSNAWPCGRELTIRQARHPKAPFKWNHTGGTGLATERQAEHAALAYLMRSSRRLCVA